MGQCPGFHGVSTNDQRAEIVYVTWKQVQRAFRRGTAVPSGTGYAFICVNGDFMQPSGSVEMASVPDSRSLPLEYFAGYVCDLHCLPGLPLVDI